MGKRKRLIVSCTITLLLPHFNIFHLDYYPIFILLLEHGIE